MGLVNKEESSELLIKAIEKVYAGEPWFDRSLLGSILAERSGARQRRREDPERARLGALTERERAIIKLVGDGLQNREIGQRLDPRIGETTVRNHLNSIYSKLGIKGGRFELLIYAYHHGLASPPSLGTR